VRWLPTDYCYFRCDKEPEDDHIFCRGDSNGCASGNNLEEAILQGFLELVERDATAMWWYNRVRRPAIDLESFQDPFFDRMMSWQRDQGRTLVALDITSDLGIPAAVAASWDDDGGKILMGLGAHLDARLAVSRAISELNQSLPLVGFGDATEAYEDFKPQEASPLVSWFESEDLDSQPHLVPDSTNTKSAESYPNMHADDLLDDVHACMEIVHEKGLEMIVLDLTRPDVDFSTVRVTVPGLRHFWARFAPGRLYDVPVEAGWSDRKLDESELNPIPFFL
jgi:ribosomal protein S12 methylthiotransferase accessory factor